MDKWEYKQIDANIEELNKLGKKGWEAISMAGAGAGSGDGGMSDRWELSWRILLKRKL